MKFLLTKLANTLLRFYHWFIDYFLWFIPVKLSKSEKEKLLFELKDIITIIGSNDIEYLMKNARYIQTDFNHEYSCQTLSIFLPNFVKITINNYPSGNKEIIWYKNFTGKYVKHNETKYAYTKIIKNKIYFQQKYLHGSGVSDDN